MNIKIKLSTPSAKIPTRGSDFAAGYDLYTSDNHTLAPGERHLYKTGITTEMPNGIYGRITPRSGLAYKNGIDVMAGVIDSDYRDEIGVVLINLDSKPWTPVPDKAIAQIIFEYHNVVVFEQTNELKPSERDKGGFGHSDNKKVEIPKEVSNLIQKWKTDSEGHPGSPYKYETAIKEREKKLV